MNRLQTNLTPLLPAFIHTKEGKRWGYINNQGQFVLPPQFEEADDFQENGMAIARLNGKVGLINDTGQFVIEPQYNSMLPFTENRAIVTDDEGFSVINEQGQVLTKKTYGLINPYQEGRAIFAETRDDQFLYGYLDEDGNEHIPLQFELAYDFSDGKALVKIKENEFALINRDGHIVQSYPYASMMSYSEGLIAFAKTYQDNWGYVDEQGTVMIEPQFTYALPFQNERAIVNAAEGIDNQYGLINRDASYILPPTYQDMTQLGNGRVAVGRAFDPERPFTGSRYGIATTDGSVLTDFLYDQVAEYKNGLSSTTAGQFTFFINESGQREPSLPVIPGIGTITIIDDVIQANVDHSLSYYDRAGNIVYQPNTVFPLDDQYRIHIRKYSPNKDYLVYYPQIEGMTNGEAEKNVNAILRQKSLVLPVPSTQLDYGYYGDFSVAFFQNHLLILKLEGYRYPFGAAHGMPYQVHVSIDLGTGQIYQLKDLFKQDSDYVKELSDIVGQQIKDQMEQGHTYFFPDQYRGITPDQAFYVTDDALVLYFEPYEIAAYVAGFPSFTIPFKEIEGILDFTSSFWRSLHE
ncbi:WG repeat-containing protein [Halalkalibacter krulwichiae]|uniref:Anti-sigma-V factor RsiV n=1 Tax=Halalkalibacter krulwichiae TaxID=199441 RepID=A0A1X9MFR6_9BACI|nr:WG repeat-containing protein [Halalkalibacter krulwichiae]ARK32297.1 Anti-sigma-V factor RsiV [Halalkalibacter krulwichiae]